MDRLDKEGLAESTIVILFGDNGRPRCGIGEWIMYNAKIPVSDYASEASLFNPVKFDAGPNITMPLHYTSQRPLTKH